MRGDQANVDIRNNQGVPTWGMWLDSSGRFQDIMLSKCGFLTVTFFTDEITTSTRRILLKIKIWVLYQKNDSPNFFLDEIHHFGELVHLFLVLEVSKSVSQLLLFFQMRSQHLPEGFSLKLKSGFFIRKMTAQTFFLMKFINLVMLVHLSKPSFDESLRRRRNLDQTPFETIPITFHHQLPRYRAGLMCGWSGEWVGILWQTYAAIHGLIVTAIDEIQPQTTRVSTP